MTSTAAWFPAFPPAPTCASQEAPLSTARRCARASAVRGRRRGQRRVDRAHEHRQEEDHDRVPLEQLGE